MKCTVHFTTVYLRLKQQSDTMTPVDHFGIFVASTLSCKVPFSVPPWLDFVACYYICHLRTCLALLSVWICDWSILKLPPPVLNWNSLLMSEGSCHWNEQQTWLDQQQHHKQRPLLSIHWLETKTFLLLQGLLRQMALTQWQGTNSDKGRRATYCIQ